MDYLLIDMPPGTGDVQMALGRLLPRTEMVVVTTPALAAQKVAVRVADMARRSYLKVLGVIENMSTFTCDHGETYALFGVGRRPDAGHRPGRAAARAQCRWSPRSAVANDAGTPLSVARPDERGRRRVRRHRRPHRRRAAAPRRHGRLHRPHAGRRRAGPGLSARPPRADGAEMYPRRGLFQPGLLPVRSNHERNRFVDHRRDPGHRGHRAAAPGPDHLRHHLAHRGRGRGARRWSVFRSRGTRV